MSKRHTFLATLSALARLIGGLLKRWPVLLIIALLASPIGPHLRVEYTYNDYYWRSHFHPKIYTSCTYLGSRGLIHPYLEPDCPVIVMLDARDFTNNGGLFDGW